LANYEQKSPPSLSSSDPGNIEDDAGTRTDNEENGGSTGGNTGGDNGGGGDGGDDMQI